MPCFCCARRSSPTTSATSLPEPGGAGGGTSCSCRCKGAENNRFIPNHKTEQLLICSGLAYTLLRPAYFMQNFTTTLRADLVERHRIFLPAGRARFTLIDVDDISRVGGTSAKSTPSRPSTGSRFSRWPTSSPPAWVGKSPISRPVPSSFSGSKSARDWPQASS